MVVGGVGYAFKQMDDILSVIRAILSRVSLTSLLRTSYTKGHVRELHPSIWWLVVVGLTISPIRAIVVSIFAQHPRLDWLVYILYHIFFNLSRGFRKVF